MLLPHFDSYPTWQVLMYDETIIDISDKKNETEDAANDHKDELSSSVIDGVKTFAFSLHSHTVGTAL